MLGQPISVLGDPRYAIWAVTLATAWKGLPLVFIIILSALQSLEPQYLEAAKVDGASWRSQLRHVILPHLRSSIALAAVLSAVYNFSLFDLAYLLTGGGPAGTHDDVAAPALQPEVRVRSTTGAPRSSACDLPRRRRVAGRSCSAVDGLRRRRFYA